MNKIIVKLLPSKRDSNIELFRIILMVLVLVTHANYLALYPPTQMEISNSLDGSVIRGLCESLSKVCVNSFILISGWYTIRSTWHKFFQLIFQVLFISIFVYAVMRLLGLILDMTTKEWADLLLFKHRGYWFVRAYIILFLFAPVLNTYVAFSSKKQIRTFLLFFFSVQLVYGFYNYGDWYAGGYSPLSFMGIYVLGRYMAVYPNKYTKFDKKIDFFIYLTLSMITTICSLSLTYFFNSGGTVLLLYSSPFVIISSVYLFLFFTKISFYNRLVNWIAESCFAVYLVHTLPCVLYQYYIDVIKHWFETELASCFLLYTFILIIAFFALAVFLDKIRLRVWSFFCEISR